MRQTDNPESDPPDALEVLRALVGTTISTLSGRPNRIVALDGDEVVVGTGKSPEGQRVPIAWVQAGIDRLWRDGEVRVDVASLGHRGAFVGAVLATLPDTTTLQDPARVRLGTRKLVTEGSRATLVGCVATTGSAAAPAKDLYTSELFRARRAYAERQPHPWFVVSALLGLVEPDETIAPYDQTLRDLRPTERRALGEHVAGALEARLGLLEGAQLEVHAGEEYREVIGPALRRRGAQLVNPVAGLRIGEQLAWYARQAGGSASPRPQPARQPLDGLAARITEAFNGGRLDLSARPGAPAPGWPGMPELEVADAMRARGASDRDVRLLLTFGAALDRARDADALWHATGRLHEHDPWAIEPSAIVAASLTELTDVLRRHRVSQRHGLDAAAWRTIAESLLDPRAPDAVRTAVDEGRGSAPRLLEALRETTSAGTPYLPYLQGPKVGPMWVRMLALPGNATIEQLDVLPVAVDVQVRKVSEYLGATDTRGLELDRARPIIQRAWSADVAAHGAAGPGALAGTCAALDPALWFWGKWGCTRCERSGRRMPIADVCHERCEAFAGEGVAAAL